MICNFMQTIAGESIKYQVLVVRLVFGNVESSIFRNYEAKHFKRYLRMPYQCLVLNTFADVSILNTLY